MRVNYDEYLEIMDNYININWNFENIYKKMIDKIIEKYIKDNVSKEEKNEGMGSALKVHPAVDDIMSNREFRINCTKDMFNIVMDFIKDDSFDNDYKNDILIIAKISTNISITKGYGYNAEYKLFSLEEIKRLEEILNLKKDYTKIYKTRSGNYSLEAIYDNGRYCEEELCDVAGIYVIPDDVKIIISGGRLRLEENAYLIDNMGKPAIGIYMKENKSSKLEKMIVLKDSVHIKDNNRKSLKQVQKVIEDIKLAKKDNNIEHPDKDCTHMIQELRS